jgi:hypothetical protein
MKWIAKAVVQKSISFLPFKEKINLFFQKYVTKGVELTDQHFQWKIEAAERHIRYFKKYSEHDISKTSVLELGSGWYPIVPIALYLSGFESVTTIDIYSWGSNKKLHEAIAKFIDWNAQGKLRQYITVDTRRWSVLIEMHNQHVDVDKFNAKLNIIQHLGDARTFDFPNAYGLICSNNTLEHIPVNNLEGILMRFQMLLLKGGIMSHLVDLSDHFAHGDRSITIYNFLKFSDKAWILIDNDIQPQNRLRFNEYVNLYQKLGISIVYSWERMGELEELRSVKLNKKYEKFDERDLLISHADFVSC